jgi:arsenite-transporting ATPase
VVNKSMWVAGTRDPVLNGRMQGERRQLARVEGGLAQRTFALPWASSPPVGLSGLAALLLS